MGFRFRKSFGKGPFRVTVSKSGVGYSVGGKGFRYTKKAGGGTRTTASIPGTGISFVSDSGSKAKNSRPVSSKPVPSTASPVKPIVSNPDTISTTPTSSSVINRHKYCPKCRKEIPLDATKCPHCGKRWSGGDFDINPIWGIATLILGLALIGSAPLLALIFLIATICLAVKGMKSKKSKALPTATVVAPEPQVEQSRDEDVQAIVQSLHNGTFKETIHELYGESYTEGPADKPIVSEPDTMVTSIPIDSTKHLHSTKKANPKAYTLPVFNLDFIHQCKKSFIAFDVETTGFDATNDHIIEISAVRFVDFKAVEFFSSLVNPHTHIPSAASKVNHIYDSDVASAPDLEQVIPQLCAFLGEDVLDGSVEIVAHNAIFDIKFLLHALARCDIDADVSFQDTLLMCRESELGLENNKLGTVAKHFGIQQHQRHRAEDDAYVCGEIFIKLLSAREEQLNNLLSELTEVESDICKWLKGIFDEADLNTQFLHFYSGTYLSCICVYDVVKFKTRARTPYVLIKNDYPFPNDAKTAATSKAEGEKYTRYLFHEVSDLVPLKDYFINRYRETYASAERFFSASDKNLKEAARQVSKHLSL